MNDLASAICLRQLGYRGSGRDGGARSGQMTGPIRPDAHRQLHRGVSGVGSDQLRRHNLSAILTLLHHDGSQPRSMLTAQTGLNRSTVAALVGRARASAASSTRPIPIRPGRWAVRARRSTPTSATSRSRSTPRSTRSRSASSRSAATSPSGSATRPTTPPTAREAVNISTAVIEGLTDDPLERGRITGIGVAVPGLVRADDGLVKLAPHLDWVDEPVARHARRGDRLRRLGRQRREPRRDGRAHLRGRPRARRHHLPQRRPERHRRRRHRQRRPARRHERICRRVRPHPRRRNGSHARRRRGAPLGPARRARHHSRRAPTSSRSLLLRTPGPRGRRAGARPAAHTWGRRWRTPSTS